MDAETAPRFAIGAALAAALLAASLPASAAAQGADGTKAPDGRRPIAELGVPADASGEELYRAACAHCHGADGAGAPKDRVGFETPLPDFTDCFFATREPDADWLAVAHAGGPVRGFAPMMPAFDGLLTVDQLQRTMDHIRSFCGDQWPRGELNFPRAMFTEKAYPEDEVVFTTGVSAEGRGAVSGELIWENRFGARNMIEVVIPFGWRERLREGAAPGETDWTGGIGDIAFGVKRDFFHSLESGTIVSLTGEVVLPTGDEDDGFGTGTTIFEPFVSVGQRLPAGGFLHAQAGAGIPADADRATEEGFWRMALGKSFQQGMWGRVWSPMVELLGSRELTAGEPTHWDLVPQLHVTLNTRQHVMANVAVRLPLDDADVRDTEVLVFVLWDWFDGGPFAGW